MVQIKYVRWPVPSGAADAGTAGRPLHTIRSYVFTSCQQMHTEPVEMLTFLAGFAEKPTEKPTEICSDSVSFLFGFFK